MFTCLHVKYPLFFPDFNETWSLTDFRQIFKYRISWNPVLWKKVCSMRTDKHTDGRRDGQTDMTKLTVALDNFANEPPKNQRDRRKEGSSGVKHFLFVKTCHESSEHKKTGEVTWPPTHRIAVSALSVGQLYSRISRDISTFATLINFDTTDS